MGTAELSARPEPLLISSDTTAIVVNDMQNAFCSPGYEAASQALANGAP
jgi:hypothetical protein